MNPFIMFPVWFEIPLMIICLLYFIIGGTGFLYEPCDRYRHEVIWTKILVLDGRTYNTFTVLLVLFAIIYVLQIFLDLEYISTGIYYLTLLTCLFGWFWVSEFAVRTVMRITNYFIKRRKQKCFKN